MKKIALFILILTFSSLLLPFCGEEKEQRWNNGIEWREYSHGMKIGYLKGMNEGFDFCQQSIVVMKSLTEQESRELNALETVFRRYLKQGGPIAQQVEGIDKMYTDNANVHIPILDIMEFVNSEMSGELTEAELQNKLLEMRKGSKW